MKPTYQRGALPEEKIEATPSEIAHCVSEAYMQLKEKMRSEFAKDASGDFWVSQLPAHAKDMLKCPEECTRLLKQTKTKILVLNCYVANAITESICFNAFVHSFLYVIMVYVVSKVPTHAACHWGYVIASEDRR